MSEEKKVMAVQIKISQDPSHPTMVNMINIFDEVIVNIAVTPSEFDPNTGFSDIVLTMISELMELLDSGAISNDDVKEHKPSPETCGSCSTKDICPHSEADAKPEDSSNGSDPKRKHIY